MHGGLGKDAHFRNISRACIFLLDYAVSSKEIPDLWNIDNLISTSSMSFDNFFKIFATSTSKEVVSRCKTRI